MRAGDRGTCLWLVSSPASRRGEVDLLRSPVRGDVNGGEREGIRGDERKEGKWEKEEMGIIPGLAQKPICKQSTSSRRILSATRIYVPTCGLSRSGAHMPLRRWPIGESRESFLTVEQRRPGPLGSVAPLPVPATGYRWETPPLPTRSPPPASQTQLRSSDVRGGRRRRRRDRDSPARPPLALAAFTVRVLARRSALLARASPSPARPGVHRASLLPPFPPEPSLWCVS